MMNRRVLVTGGAGFIGSHVVDELLARGYQPYVVDDLSSGRRENLPAEVPLYEVDICDGEKACDPLCGGLAPVGLPLGGTLRRLNCLSIWP